MTETKTVVMGQHGPVPREDNSLRYIGAEPVTIPMTSYYLRRMMCGELVEYVAPAAPAALEPLPMPTEAK